MNDLNDIYGDSANNAKPTERADLANNSVAEDSLMGEDGAEQSAYDSDSDSDVEFVITTKIGQRAEPPANKSQPYSAIKLQKTGVAPAVSEKREPVAKLPDVDVDAIAELDGKSILDIDLETLENKPWRLPGADITEYFNYGFDEFTWAAYCQKQASLRTDYAPTKVMQNMMGAMDPSMMGGMGPGMMMPPMDASMMQQMYNPMNMDFLQGPPASFGGPMTQSNYNRPSSASLHGRDNHSPMPLSVSEVEKRDELQGLPNIPKGPSQGKSNYRNRGAPSRW